MGKVDNLSVLRLTAASGAIPVLAARGYRHAGSAPDAASEDVARIDEVRAALGKLPDAYLEALVLQVRMGLSTAEIALKLKLPLEQVLSRLCRARKELRRLCGGDIWMDPEG